MLHKCKHLMFDTLCVYLNTKNHHNVGLRILKLQVIDLFFNAGRHSSTENYRLIRKWNESDWGFVSFHSQVSFWNSFNSLNIFTCIETSWGCLDSPAPGRLLGFPIVSYTNMCTKDTAGCRKAKHWQTQKSIIFQERRPICVKCPSKSRNQEIQNLRNHDWEG